MYFARVVYYLLYTSRRGLLDNDQVPRGLKHKGGAIPTRPTPQPGVTREPSRTPHVREKLPSSLTISVL